MVLKVFRLNKDTTTDATFTIGQTIDSKSMKFLGYQWDNFDGSQQDAYSNYVDSDIPICAYLKMDILSNHNVAFYQGMNYSSDSTYSANHNVENCIPLGVQGIDTSFQKLNLTLINKPGTLFAEDSISFSLLLINQGHAYAMTDAMAFGEDIWTNSETEANFPADHGVSLFFEFDDCDFKQDDDYDIVDATRNDGTDAEVWIDPAGE